MAFATITLENPLVGKIKQAPVGFSWTTAFFGFFPALFRGDWKWAVILLILALITFGLSSLVFMFLYNRLYLNDLIADGFKATDISKGSMDEAAAKLGFRIPQLEE